MTPGDAITGAVSERQRTLAILDSFLAAGIPPHDKILVQTIHDRVTARSVVDVIADKKPVIQHDQPRGGRKPSRTRKE